LICSIFCIPWDQVGARHQQEIYTFINKYMDGKRVVIIITKMDSYKDTEESKVNLQRYILSNLNLGIRESVTFHMTSGHEMYTLTKLEEFLHAHPSIADGDDLKVALKGTPFGRDLSVKSTVLKSRSALLEHVRARLLANKSGEVMSSMADLFVNSETYSYRGHYALLRELHDKWTARLTELESADGAEADEGIGRSALPLCLFLLAPHAM
jgi:hypothetical protein